VKLTIFKILILGLLLRLFLAPFTFHSDTIDFLNWGRNLEKYGLNGFYARDTADAGPPNYPPGFYYILFLNQKVYKTTKEIFWNINVNIPLFPSNIYLWLESDRGAIFFNKLPAIFADLGIAYLIYKIVHQIKGKLDALVSSAFFVFSPWVWYISSVWGQTDSLFALPLLYSFYLLLRGKYTYAPLIFVVSFLIKPTVVLVAPIFLFWWLTKINFSNFIKSTLISLPFFYLAHLMFNQRATLDWIVNFYILDVREISGYLVSNSYNIWSLLYGFIPKPDNFLIYNIPAYFWGIGIFILFVIYFCLNLKKDTKPKLLFLACAILSFSGFLFLTGMHERYLFITLTLLALLVSFDKKIKITYIILSLVGLFNLYHFWWIPRFELLINILSSKLSEQLLVGANVSVFIWLINHFRKELAKV